MNDASNSIISWLEHLTVLMPPSAIALVGAGSGKGGWVKWLQTQAVPLTLVEADMQKFVLLKRQEEAGLFCKASLINSVVAPEVGEVEFFTASLSSENGLLTPESLTSIWNNLHTVQAQQRKAISLVQLLPVETLHQWLILDCLPAASLLSAEVVTSRLDVVVARVLLTESADQSHIGSHLTDLASALPGFTQLALQPSRHPNLAYALFVRDYKTAWQAVNRAYSQQTDASHAAQLKWNMMLHQAQSKSIELLEKQERKTQEFKELEANFADIFQKLDCERRVNQELMQKQRGLESECQNYRISNAVLQEAQEQKVHAYKALEVNLAEIHQALDAEQKASQAALQKQGILEVELQQAKIIHASLKEKQEQQKLSSQALEATFAELQRKLEIMQKARHIAVQSGEALEVQLQQSQASNAALREKQGQQLEQASAMSKDFQEKLEGANTEITRVRQALHKKAVELRSAQTNLTQLEETNQQQRKINEKLAGEIARIESHISLIADLRIDDRESL